MRSEKHTEEPWFVDKLDGCMYGPDHKLLSREIDFAHTTVCVNALAGLKPEAIAGMVPLLEEAVIFILSSLNDNEVEWESVECPECGADCARYDKRLHRCSECFLKATRTALAAAKIKKVGE